MAAVQRRTIDPETRDYVVVRGDFKADGTDLRSKALFLWRLRKGSAGAAPHLGAEFHKIKVVNDAGLRKAEQTGRAAWKPLVDSGEMSDIQITASAHPQVPGRIRLRADYRNRTGKRDVLDHDVQVGS